MKEGGNEQQQQASTPRATRFGPCPNALAAAGGRVRSAWAGGRVGRSVPAGESRRKAQAAAAKARIMLLDLCPSLACLPFDPPFNQARPSPNAVIAALRKDLRQQGTSTQNRWGARALAYYLVVLVNRGSVDPATRFFDPTAVGACAVVGVS